MGDVLELDTTEQIEGVEEEEEAVVSQVRVVFDRYSVMFLPQLRKFIGLTYLQ